MAHISSEGLRLKTSGGIFIYFFVKISFLWKVLDEGVGCIARVAHGNSR
jgi:hypothetical protein